jgi:hypothetical protein
MNACWCAPSGGGCSGGQVSSIVSVATHDVCPGCAGLMAGLVQQAGGTVVANLGLVAMHLAVPNLVPSWFGVTPVGRANTGLCQWDGGCWCRRGWDSSSAHLCNAELDVGNGFGEHCVGGHQVLDGDVLLNCCICQIIEGRCHLLCMFEFGGLVCAK